MIIHTIKYSSHFKKQFIALPRAVQKKAVKAEALLRQDAFHPSLRLHKLKGRLQDTWSISIDRKYRIVFKPIGDGAIIFFNVGMHAIYDV